MRKSFLILMPTILVTASLAYIDRSNVAYAATTIKKQLNITNSQYGLGSGLLYVSYCFFQVTLQNAPHADRHSVASKFWHIVAYALISILLGQPCISRCLQHATSHTHTSLIHLTSACRFLPSL